MGQGCEQLKDLEAGGGLPCFSEEHVVAQSLYVYGPSCLSSRQRRTFLHSWEKTVLFGAHL